MKVTVGFAMPCDPPEGDERPGSLEFYLTKDLCLPCVPHIGCTVLIPKATELEVKSVCFGIGKKPDDQKVVIGLDSCMRESYDMVKARVEQLEREEGWTSRPPTIR